MGDQGYKIKGWDRFQHYNKPKPAWIKLHRSLLDDHEFQSLDPTSRALLVMLWLLAAESINGTIPGHKAIAWRLRMRERDIDSQVPRLQHFLEPLYSESSDVLASDREETETETEGEKESAGKPAMPPPKKRHLRFVELTEDEHQKLKARLNGHADEMIERLDGYIGQIGQKKAAAKYRSHYDTILNWWRKDVSEGKVTAPEPPEKPEKKIPHDVTYSPKGEAFRNGERCPEFD